MHTIRSRKRANTPYTFENHTSFKLSRRNVDMWN